jgi:hypothetical protein
MRLQEYVRTLKFDQSEESSENCVEALPQKPKLIADAEVQDRIERLNEVWGHANAAVRHLSYKYRKLWDGAITELTDRKGTLYITWRDEVSRVMFEGVILGAWEANAEYSGAHSLNQ